MKAITLVAALLLPIQALGGVAAEPLTQVDSPITRAGAKVGCQTATDAVAGCVSATDHAKITNAAPKADPTFTGIVTTPSSVNSTNKAIQPLKATAGTYSTAVSVGELANTNLLVVSLSADDRISVEVEILATRYDWNAKFRVTAVGYRAAGGTATWAVNAVTSETLNGSPTAPAFAWVSTSGGDGTLQFQPGASYTTYLVQTKWSSYNGTTVTPQ